MQLDLEKNTAPTSIHAYSDQGILIDGRWYNRHLLLTPDKVITDWQAKPVVDLEYVHLQVLLSGKPEVLILGTGKQICFPPHRLFADLAADGIGLEVMNTEAACRTFNILLSEDRAVAALLFIE